MECACQADAADECLRIKIIALKKQKKNKNLFTLGQTSSPYQIQNTGGSKLRSISLKAEQEPSPGSLSPLRTLSSPDDNQIWQRTSKPPRYLKPPHLRSEVKAISHTVDSTYHRHLVSEAKRLSAICSSHQ